MFHGRSAVERLFWGVNLIVAVVATCLICQNFLSAYIKGDVVTELKEKYVDRMPFPTITVVMLSLCNVLDSLYSLYQVTMRENAKNCSARGQL